MDSIRDNEAREKEARKLRELFRGRFDQETAMKLIRELGGLLQAVDFVMNEKEDVVRSFLKQSKEYLDSLRSDSERVATILKNDIENTVRQFACQECHRAWWQRVPLRKEVSRCQRCNNKYDPVPREHEFGLGKFLCQCGNEFTGFATMGETKSPCFKCGIMVPVDSMMPPRRNHKTKTKTPHSCNGQNCYNQSHDHGHNEPSSSNGDTGSYTDLRTDPYISPTSMNVGRGQRRRQADFRDNQDDNDDRITSHSHAHSTSGMIQGRNSHSVDQDSDQTHADDPVCVHPKSSKKGIRHFSNRHISSGTTVSSFMTQRSIDTQSISVMSLLTIKE